MPTRSWYIATTLGSDALGIATQGFLESGSAAPSDIIMGGTAIYSFTAVLGSTGQLIFSGTLSESVARSELSIGSAAISGSSLESTTRAFIGGSGLVVSGGSTVSPTFNPSSVVDLSIGGSATVQFKSGGAVGRGATKNITLDKPKPKTHRFVYTGGSHNSYVFLKQDVIVSFVPAPIPVPIPVPLFPITLPDFTRIFQSIDLDKQAPIPIEVTEPTLPVTNIFEYQTSTAMKIKGNSLHTTVADFTDAILLEDDWLLEESEEFGMNDLNISVTYV